MEKTQWSSHDFITPDTITAIRDAVEKANGNEIFLIGRLNNEHRVTEVDVYAMGNKCAVPAIIKEAKFGDVIIHNHPNGILDPSDADIEIASYLGSQGIGCYIVDNDVEYLYPVVKVPKKRTHEILDFETLSKQLLPDGNFTKQLPRYEYRKQQIEMLKSVTDAFNQDRIALIEAGTGTGKSLAYLIPAVFWSKKNQERIVISTHTINLQEQLIEKDIPLLEKCCEFPFKGVLVKGRNNYVCQRKVHALHSDGGTLIEDTLRQQLNDLLDWAAKTLDGSKSDLNFVPKDDVWEAIQSEADQCTRLKCRFYDTCFFYIARRSAASADILIVNHYLLMADLVMRQETKGYETAAILPPFRKIILDEAHHLEDVATANLSSIITRLKIIKPLGKLINVKDNKKGLLHYLKSKLNEVCSVRDNPIAMHITDKINTEIIEARHFLYDATQNTFEVLSLSLTDYIARKNLQKNREEETKLRITEQFTATDLWQNTIEDNLKELIRNINTFVSLLKTLLDEIGELSKKSQDIVSSVIIDIASCATRLKLAANAVAFFISPAEKHCKWIEIKKYKESINVRFCSAPLSVAEGLKTCLYDNYNTLILTSATLAVNRSFLFFKKNIGLSQNAEHRLSELILDSPFDYKKQAILGIPTDIPEPNETGYISALEENILKTIEISNGRALILFTSYSLLDTLYKKLEPPITHLGYTCLKQGTNNRHILLETFKNDKTSVLLATDSFWEGIDVKGDALECVILTRLPFKVPTEPIIEARSEEIERTGGDPFYDYSLPLAVIKFKQGFGRLIRSRDDRGVVILFDRRIVTRKYGHVFLQSLPDIGYIKDKSDVVFNAVRQFLHNTAKPAGNRIKKAICNTPSG